MTLRYGPLLLAACGVLAIVGAVLWQRAHSAPVSPATTAPEHGPLRVFDREITGPAAGIQLPADAVNRLGSTSVGVRVYEPSDQEPWATLVWAHGGSFVRGSLDWPESDWVAREFAATGLRVYAVDYVLASDTVKAPAPANDVAAVVAAVHAAHPGSVLLGGASAGAHLATAAALDPAQVAAQQPAASPAATDAARATPVDVAALLLVYPTFHRVQETRSDISAETQTLPANRQFGAERIAEMYDFYLGDESPGVLPVGEQSQEALALLPPTIMVHAEADDLRASGEQFEAQLRQAGVSVAARVEPGTVHGYLNRPEASAQAVREATATIRFLSDTVRGQLGG